MLECRSVEAKISPPQATGEKIEGKIPQAPQRALDVVPEHPEEDHVAEDMGEIRMEELISQERHPAGTQPRAGMSPVNAAGVRL